jgi:sodium/proline symporter
MNLYGALAAMFTGFFTVILWNTFLSSTGIYELLPGFILAFVVGVVVSLITPAPDQEVIDEFEKAEAIEKESA